MASINADIKNGNIANVYLFYGEEAFKRKNFKELLKASPVFGNSMNCSIFEGKDIDYQAVYDAVVTMPFFAEKRLVIVENTGKFKSSKKETEEIAEEDEEEKSAGMLEKIFASLPASTCLAFFEETAAKNKKTYKLVAAKGIVYECVPDTEDDVINWMARGLASQGKQVRRSTLALLVERCGLDYTQLKTELDKIMGFVGERAVIEDSDILTMTSENVESKIFDMLDAMGNKNTKLVLDKYFDLLTNKEHPLYIMAMIRMQLRNLLQIAELKKKRLSKSEIAKAMKKPSFVVDKAERALKNFKTSDIIAMLDEISTIDKQSKTGDMTDQIGVEMLLVKFSK